MLTSTDHDYTKPNSRIYLKNNKTSSVYKIQYFKFKFTIFYSERL